MDGPWVDIDLSSLKANYRMIDAATPSAAMAAVVKCNGYGLGADQIATTLARDEGCNAFFVAYPQEGMNLRKTLAHVTPAPEIFVFNGPSAETMALFSDYALTPVLNTLAQAEIWTAAKRGVPAAVHVDTGMNRFGVAPDELNAIATLSDLNVSVFMSHLACGSAPDHEMNRRQLGAFHQLAGLFPSARKSLSASAGALMDPSFHFDLIRPGIALYGGSPFSEPVPRLPPVASLRAPIVQVRDASAGETVGYDASHKLVRDSRLATIALGYGDGYPRTASNRGHIFVGGALAPVVGKISMDLTIVDVTGVQAPLRPGDHAEIFGANRPIHDAANECGTISYELLTNLGGRVDRRYL